MVTYHGREFDFNLNARAYPWTKKNGILVRGFAHFNGQVFRDEAFAELFSEVKNKEEFQSLLDKIDGFFSIVVILDDKVIAAVDHLRSLPLFYYREGTKWVLSDRISVSFINNHAISSESLWQLGYALEVFGRNTVCTDVFQIEAGEYIVIQNSEVYNFRWWSYSYQNNPIGDVKEAINRLERGYDKSFQQLIRAIDNRTAVIPLSGGHDSRLIAYELKKRGVDNIVAYSYGKVNNPESVLAKQVADELNIPFIFIEHDYKQMQKWRTRYMEAYLDYAGNGVSVPCVQEVFSVYYLKKESLIPTNAVFIPGYTGDFLTGAHIPIEGGNQTRFSKEQFLDEILARHCNENSVVTDNDGDRLKRIIDKEYDIPAWFCSFSEYAEACETIDFMERQSKFIVNSVRAFEFYNYEWILPEFDKNQFEVWMSIPVSLRKERFIYFQYEDELYPQTISTIGFADETKEKKRLRNHISKYSIFPWTDIAHPLFTLASIPEYAKRVYIKRNRRINNWVFCKYKALIDRRSSD